MIFFANISANIAARNVLEVSMEPSLSKDVESSVHLAISHPYDCSDRKTKNRIYAITPLLFILEFPDFACKSVLYISTFRLFALFFYRGYFRCNSNSKIGRKFFVGKLPEYCHSRLENKIRSKIAF